MNVLGSECSSGCESGWTLYLEHSNSNGGVSFRGDDFYYGDEEKKMYGDNNVKADYEQFGDDEEEEDMSMVSDASSGPPHLNEEDEVLGCYFNNNGVKATVTSTAKMPGINGGNDKKLLKKKKKKRDQCRRSEKEKLPCYLDDTASSPVINFSSKKDFELTNNNNQASMESMLDYSQSFSATHFQGRSAFQDHFGFLQPSSLSGNHLQNSQWY